MKKILLVLMLMSVIFSLGCTKSDNLTLGGNTSNESTEEKINIEDEEIDVSGGIIESKKSTEVKETNLSDLIDEKVSEILGDYKNNVSIYFKNLNTNEEYMLNENEYYVAASTTKVALAMMILDEVNNGQKSLDDLLYFIEEDREGGSGVLYYLDEIPVITIQEAIKLSIVSSDNVAKNMLRRVANSSTTNYMKLVIGDDDIPYGNYSTAKQLGILLNRLYENPENNPYYDMLIEYMINSDYHDRLDKYLDYDLVAHKIGSYYRYYHDIGIIYGEDPYILVVLTKDIGELSTSSFEDDGEDERYVLDWGEEACELIANLSEEIYTIVEESKIKS